jgi:hypothetical protein
MGAELLQWLPEGLMTALAAIIWFKLNKIESKQDRILETELRYIDVRLALLEQHCGLTPPPRPV